MIKENTKAPIFKLPSTNKKEYSLKDSIGNYVIIYCQGVQLKPMILISYFQNLKN